MSRINYLATKNPDVDGLKWVKCGKKNIKGEMYPRCYYRCGEERECKAKKKVQMTENGLLYEVTYVENHGCLKHKGNPWAVLDGISTPVIPGGVYINNDDEVFGGLDLEGIGDLPAGPWCA